MATIKLPGEGQELNLDDEIAGDDALLRSALAVFYPQMSNAEIKRETNTEGEMVVTLIKRAGTKGCNISEVLQVLYHAPEEVNPILALTWQLKKEELAGDFTVSRLIALQFELQAALREGEPEEKRVERSLGMLKVADGIPTKQVIYGF